MATAQHNRSERHHQFAQRLAGALQFGGIHDRAAMIRKTAEAGGVTRATARRWLAGKSSPRPTLYAYEPLSEALGVNLFWLYGYDDAPEPKKWKFQRRFAALSEVQQEQIARFVDGLADNDPKACALRTRFENGEITADDLLAQI